MNRPSLLPLAALLLFTPIVSAQAPPPAEKPAAAKPASRSKPDPTTLPADLGPHAVTAVKDISYFGGPDADPAKHQLDVFLPRDVKNAPVLFFVHGGTWQSGDRKVYPRFGEVFASHGIATVIPSYRLSPKVKHPEHIKDVARAFAWTKKNIARHGGDPNRIVICGHSAGGHLVALLATDPTYLKAEGCTAGDLRGVIGLSGVYNIPPIAFAKIFGTDLETCRRASPITHVKGDHPPFLLAYADRDLPVLDMLAEQMAGALKKVQTDVRTLKIKDRDHVTIMVHILDKADPTREAILGFVDKYAARGGDMGQGASAAPARATAP